MLNGVRQPILYSFVFGESLGYKVFCEPGTILYKKIKQSNLNSITVHLEKDNHEEVDFNGETLTFTLQKVKFETLKELSEILK